MGKHASTVQSNTHLKATSKAMEPRSWGLQYDVTLAWKTYLGSALLHTGQGVAPVQVFAFVQLQDSGIGVE